MNKPSDSGQADISTQLSDNLAMMKEIFANCSDITILPWHYGPDLKYSSISVYYDTLVQKKEHNYFKETLQDLVTEQVGPGTSILPEKLFTFYENDGASAQSAFVLYSMDQAVIDVLNGHIVIFFDMWDKALSYKAMGVEKRQVTEPTTEPVVLGPKESTIEDLDKNIGMLRMRLKSTKFKIEIFAVESETKTQVAYGYLEGAVLPEVFSEFKQKIDGLQSGEILETSYIEELIEGSSLNPFPQCRYTERPDVAVAELLNGKIIVMVDGTGSILICPATFTELLQSSEDYYQRTLIASLIRLMRYIAFFIALMLPSVYIALSTFHTELIPTVLLLAILNSREGIPFPAIFEALIMELSFELLREAGVRLPRPVGSAVSIVGALVVGEASINAGVASPILVIIVALTGIASFSLPQFNFAVALRILRFPLMVFSAFLGGYGLMIALLLMWLLLAHMRTLGQPYMSPLAPFKPKLLSDVLIRAPLQTMLRSPRQLQLKKRRS
ncbi:spore germination protein [Paenibacillus rigui]|uniref:Spore germination protein n=1 Tax=Paenibacillus rigui TaxID=554312 RepID=A0A229ULR3_9BACL|nr:spore germination protein [Paenibacillus rigui]OXM83839.1 spore germination protein [Paenibacillus rigui]